MTHDQESNDEYVAALSDDDLADGVEVSDVEDAISRARAGGATEQDIHDLIANAAQGEFVGTVNPPEPKDLDALSDENNERLADADAASEAALVDSKASEESVKAQAQAKLDEDKS